MTFPVGWQRKCALTISGAQVVGSGTHASFPVLLTPANLPSEMLDKDGSHPAQVGGGDIRFTSDEAGTVLLPCHVIDFAPHNTPASGKALIYVGVDLVAGANRTIYVWYHATTKKRQPKYDANTDADGFKGSDYVWANYDIMLQFGGFGGLRNLKQANASKNAGRYGIFSPKAYTVASRETGNTYIAFPKLFVLGDRLYCGVREATAHIVVANNELRFYYSEDFGRSWAVDSALTISSASDMREAHCLLDDQGTLWVFYSKANVPETTRAICYRKATAPYTSWGDETVLTGSMTRASMGALPIQLASGRIVVPGYDINGSVQYWPFVRWTDDYGSNWTTDFISADGAAPGAYDAYTEMAIAENPDSHGDLIAIIRREGSLTQYKSFSTDSGQTWSTISSEASLPIDDEAVDLPDMPSLLVTSDGDLLVAYAKDRFAPELRVLRSTDFGATWDTTNIASVYANIGDSTIKPDGFNGLGGYVGMAELSPGFFAAAYFYDTVGVPERARVYCTHFTKVEDGALNFWTDTARQTTGQVDKAIDLDATREHIGNGSVSYFNQVHNGGAFTISGWAKLDSIADKAHALIGSSGGAADKGFYFGYENRTSVGAPNALRLIKSSGVAVIDQSTASIAADTSPHRFGVFCDAGGTPTFIKDLTTYAGTTPITGTSGNATLGTRFGGCSATSGGPDVSALRLDGWMGMWGLSSVNLGADYEKTRYNAENAPSSFLSAGTPTIPDTTGPTLTGSITVTDLATTSYTITCPVATDVIGVTGYQYRLNGGSWVTIGAGGRTAAISGRPYGGSDAVEMRAFDAVPNYSSALSATVDMLTNPGTITTEAFRNYDGDLLAGVTIPNVVVLLVSDRSVVLSLSDQVTDAVTGVLEITSGDLTPDESYMVLAFNADGTVRGAKLAVAV